MIGLGAEDRMASVELARVFGLSLNLAPQVQGPMQRCATIRRHVHGNNGLLLRLTERLVDLQIPRCACASGQTSLPSSLLPFCRIASRVAQCATRGFALPMR